MSLSQVTVLRLESSEHAVLRSGFDPDQVHQVDDDQEDAEHAGDHHQAPGHLVRALILLAHRAELAMRKHAEGDAARGEAEAYDPVE